MTDKHGAAAGPPRPTAQQLREQYEIERALANRLRRASKQERRALYGTVYDELFRRVPHHSQLRRRADAASRVELVEHQLELLRRFLTPETVFLEIGAGDCALSLRVAEQAARVHAIDVSNEIAAQQEMPENFTLILSDGSTVSVPPASVTLAYSNQLMEHLHPDDALDQLHGIFAALAPGGRYFCITPNRLSGPHDISKHFDRVATGFHLVEYTAGGLSRLFRLVGFTAVTAYVNINGKYLRCPLWLLRAFELMLSALPFSLRRRIAGLSVVGGILGLVLVGRKRQ